MPREFDTIRDYKMSRLSAPERASFEVDLGRRCSDVDMSVVVLGA